MNPRPALRTALAVVTAAVLSIALVVVTYVNVASLIRASQWIAHTHDVISASDAISAALLEAEGAQRNFLVSGQTEYLASMEPALQSVQQQTERLRRLVGDNPAQTARVGALEGKIAERVTLMRANAELRKSSGLEATSDAITRGTSRRQMSAIRESVAAIKAQEETLLASRRASTQRAARTTLVTIALGGVLLLLFLGAIWALIGLDLTRRAAAEEGLRRKAGELRTTLRSIGDAVLATDASGRVTFLNPVAQDMTGWSEAEALGRDVNEIFRIVDERTRLPGEDLVHRVLSEGRVVALANHMVLLARHGTETPIADSAAPIQDEAGTVRGAVLVFRDIVEERQQRRDLQRLAAIVSNSSDAIIGESLQGEVTAWNAGAEALFGYTAAEVMGRSVAVLDPPEAEDTTLSRLDRIRKGQRVQQFDTTRLHKNGHRVAVSVSVSPIRSSDGALIGASKIIRDITDRKEAELALRASEERFRVLSSAVTSMVWVCDEEGLVTYLNLRWHEYTGLNAEQSLGEGWTRALHSEDADAVLERWRFCVASGEPYEFDLRFRRYDGTYRWFVARAKRILSRSGPIWVGTSTDIDDIKTTAAALQAAKEAAEEASRAKDRFLAVLSHELRTPLTPALASSQLLERRKDLPEDVARAVELIRRNVELETLLVDDLLDLTKISRGTIELRRKSEDLHEILHRCADICRSDLLAKRQKLTLELHGGRAPRAGRLGADAAGVLEPGQERREIHAGGRRDHGSRARIRRRAGSAFPSPTTASESPPGSCRGSSSPSSRARDRSVRARAASGSACRSRAPSSTCTGEPFGQRATAKAKGATLSVELAAFEGREPADAARGIRHAAAAPSRAHAPARRGPCRHGGRLERAPARRRPPGPGDRLPRRSRRSVPAPALRPPDHRPGPSRRQRPRSAGAAPLDPPRQGDRPVGLWNGFGRREEPRQRLLRAPDQARASRSPARRDRSRRHRRLTRSRVFLVANGSQCAGEGVRAGETSTTPARAALPSTRIRQAPDA